MRCLSLRRAISNLKITDQDDFSDQLKKLANKWYDIEQYPDDQLTIFLRSATTSNFLDISFRSIFGIANLVIKIYYSQKA